MKTGQTLKHYLTGKQQDIPEVVQVKTNVTDPLCLPDLHHLPPSYFDHKSTWIAWNFPLNIKPTEALKHSQKVDAKDKGNKFSF